MVVECSPRATQGSAVKPRTRPCPTLLGSWQHCPGLRSAWQGGSPAKGQGWVTQLQPRRGVQAQLLTGRSARLAAALTRSRVPPPSEWPRCWETLCKTVPVVLQTWRRPGPEGHCKEPNPLIRTGRLGPRPPQARADFSGRKTCKVFPVCSPGMQPAGASEASHFPWLRGWHTHSCLPGPGTRGALGRDCRTKGTPSSVAPLLHPRPSLLTQSAPSRPSSCEARPGSTAQVASRPLLRASRHPRRQTGRLSVCAGLPRTSSRVGTEIDLRVPAPTPGLGAERASGRLAGWLNRRLSCWCENPS